MERLLNRYLPDDLPDPEGHNYDHYEYRVPEFVTPRWASGIEPAVHYRRVVLRRRRTSYTRIAWEPAWARWPVSREAPQWSYHDPRVWTEQFAKDMRELSAPHLPEDAGSDEERILRFWYGKTPIEILYRATSVRHDIWGWELHSIS